MKKMTTLLAAAALLGIIAAPPAYSQGGPQWRGSDGWGAGSQYNRLYDAKAAETVSGEVIAVEYINPGNGTTNGVHLTLKTEEETVSVHLGPAWFIENQDMKIEPKDKVEIRGSRVTSDGKPAIIAAEVKNEDSVLRLRDENGVPVWAAWRRQ